MGKRKRSTFGEEGIAETLVPTSAGQGEPAVAGNASKGSSKTVKPYEPVEDVEEDDEEVESHAESDLKDGDSADGSEGGIGEDDGSEGEDDDGVSDGEDENDLDGEDDEGSDGEVKEDNAEEDEDGGDGDEQGPTDPRFVLPADFDSLAAPTTTTTTSSSSSTRKTRKAPLDPSALAEFSKTRDATGVIYLSRVPPFMKPEKLRHLLAQYIDIGTRGIGRVYLAREPDHVAARRKKYGGSKKKNYTEGWVEFLSKKDAKKVAALLNNVPIGGKKRSFYHDDIWNIRYLSGFKWTDLAAQVAYDKAAREQRMRQEAAQAAREVGEYRKNVDKARMVEAMREKKRAKMVKALAEGGQGGAAGVGVGEGAGEPQPDTSLVSAAPRFKRRFKQRKIVANEGSGLFSGVWKGKPVNEDVRKVQMSVVKKMFG